MCASRWFWSVYLILTSGLGQDNDMSVKLDKECDQKQKALGCDIKVNVIDTASPVRSLRQALCMKRSMHLDFETLRMRLRRILYRKINICWSVEYMHTHPSALIQEMRNFSLR